MELGIYGSDGVLKVTVGVDDSSTQVKELMGDNVLSLGFVLYEHVALDVNDYVDFLGERYWLMERYVPAMRNSQEWVYSIRMFGLESLIKRFLVLNSVDGDADPVFTLTASPSDHVALIVDCINEGMGCDDWTVGTVDGEDNVVIDYEGKYCNEALRELADVLGTEFWFDGTTVNVCRCERGTAVSLSHGEGLVGLEREEASNVKLYTRLFPVGSSRNIDPERYGHSRLMLPDGQKYVDVNVERYGVIHHYERDAFAGIYPRRVGRVSSVRWETASNDDGSEYRIYFFKDNALNFNPNDYELEGEVKRVSFQEGSDLAGLGEGDDHYFEVNWNNTTHEFEIITIWPYGDGTALPGGSLIPAVGDSYILWNIGMPDSYYADAEEELLAAVEEYNRKHGVDCSVYKGRTDHTWMEAHGEVCLRLGQRVRLGHGSFFEDGYRISRITKMTRKVNLPGEVDLEVSDVVGTGTMQKLNDDIKGVRTYAKEVAEGVARVNIIGTGSSEGASDSSVFSSLRSMREFLSKTGNDAAHGVISFLKGLVAKDDGDTPSVDAETIVAETIGVSGDVSVEGNSHVGSSTVDGGQTVGGNQTVSGTSDMGDAVVERTLTVEGNSELADTTIDGELKSEDASIDYDNIDLGNSGWGMRADGTLNVRAIIARSFAMFPELRLNRITAQTGVTWLTAGNGRVKSVSHTSASNVGTITLDLDIEKNGQTTASDYGTLRAGDWCIGIYHYASGNAQGDNDDSTSGLTVRGFSTIYLHVESVTGSHGETVAYKLYNQAGQALANLSSNVHPCAMMNIVAFGSNTDTTRQKSMYVTTTRAKYLFGVNSIPSLWNTDKVGMMLGDLSGITIDGRQLTAYSAYLNNIYMKGVIKQIDPNRPNEEIEVLNYLGNWQSGKTYYKNDEVWYDDALWVAKSQTASTPSDTYWKKVSAVGKNGTSYRPKGNGRQISSTSVSGTLGEIGYYNRTIYERKSTGWSALTGMELGDAYFIKMIDANLGTHVIYWDGISWNDLGNIQGPKGDTGLTGKSLTDVVTWYNYTTSADEYPTGQGQTAPYEWVDGRYIWQRRQYNWLNSDGTTDTTYDAWVNTTGSRGGNGTTPIVADVSPLLNSVPTDEEGKISAAQTLDLQLHIYEGVSPLDITGLMVDGTTILSYGSSWTNIRNNKLSVQRIMTNNRITGCRIRVNANTAQDRTYDIPIVLNRSSQSATGGYELTYTLECPRAAHSGVSPTVYSIATTEQNIKKGKSGSLVTTTITALIHKVSEGTLTDLDTTTKLTSEGLSMYFKRQNGTEHQVTQSNLTLTVSLTGSDSGSQVAIGTDQYVDIYAKRDGTKISALRIYVLNEPKEISSITMRYYLSTSPTARQGGTERDDYPEWQNGKYLWWKQRTTYSDGTYTETDWVCNAGSQGETGASGQILRMRGEWNNTTAYYNDSTFLDVVIYNGDYYKAKQNSTGHTPTDTAYWDEFNQFINLATSVLLANQGYIDVLGSGRLFVGQTENANGWEMTQGEIRHTASGLRLTPNGSMSSPGGFRFFVDDSKVGNPNLYPTNYLSQLNLGLGNATVSTRSFLSNPITSATAAMGWVSATYDASGSGGALTNVGIRWYPNAASNVPAGVKGGRCLQLTGTNANANNKYSYANFDPEGIFSRDGLYFGPRDVKAYYVGAIIKYNNKYWYCKANASSSRIPGSAPDYWEEIQRTYIYLKPSTRYTFSVRIYIPTNGNPSNQALNIALVPFNNSTLSYDTDSSHWKFIGQTGMAGGQWLTKSVTFTTDDRGYDYYAIRFGWGVGGSTSSVTAIMWVNGFKIEEGDTATELSSPATTLDDVLLQTGIDIKRKEIVVTSDKFKVQNNQGVPTFNVDKKGNAIFGGAVNSPMKVLTSDDVGDVLIKGVYSNTDTVNPSDANCYSIDLLRVSSAIKLDSSLLNTVNGLAFPFFFIYNDSNKFYIKTKTIGTELADTAHFITVDEARAMVGKKIYVYNTTLTGQSGGLNISLGYRIKKDSTGIASIVTNARGEFVPNNFALPQNTMTAFECKLGVSHDDTTGYTECLYWERAVEDDNVIAYTPIKDSDFEG